MLNIVLSHWSIYLYVFYVAVLSVLFFIYRPMSSRDREPLCFSLTSGRSAAEARTARYRRAGSSAPPVVYLYERALGRRVPRRQTG